MENVTEPDPELNRLSHVVIGAAIEVHRALGPGLLESIYESAFCIELEQRGIPYQKQPKVPLFYKDQSIGEGRLDLLVAERLVVELKAVEDFTPVHFAQILSYLRAGGFQLGLLINFNVPHLRDGIKRFVKS